MPNTSDKNSNKSWVDSAAEGKSYDQLQSEPLEIQSTDYWVKVLGMLIQNWAVIESTGTQKCYVYFFTDHAEIFDRLEFKNTEDARDGLIRNGFSLYDDDPHYADFIAKPEPPFHLNPVVHGPVYSLGEFWKEP